MIYPIKYLKTILLAMGLILLFTTCKKYPENDHLSLRSVKYRITKHDWYFSKFIINDIDSTISHLNYFTSFYSDDPRVLHFKIKPFKYGTDGSEIVMYEWSDYRGHQQFSIRSKKKHVYIETGYDPNKPNKSFFGVGNNEWAIRKLTKTDFIMEREFNNIKYRIEFKS